MASNIIELIEERFGFSAEFVENPEITSVGTTSTVIFRRDGRRVAFVVVNLGANAVYLRPDRAASSSAGIRLAPNGGNLAIIWEEDFLLPALEWTIISDGAGNNLYSLAVNIGGSG